MTELQAVTIAETKLANPGDTYRDLARKFGVSAMSICRVLNRNEIRDILTTGIQQQISLIPRAIDNYNDLLKSSDESIKLKASQDILKNTGLAPTNAPITMINNILNINTGEVPEPIRAIFAQITHNASSNTSMLDSNIIDITPDQVKR